MAAAATSTTTKVGLALLFALTSNASLLLVLLAQQNSWITPTTTIDKSGRDNSLKSKIYIVHAGKPNSVELIRPKQMITEVPIRGNRRNERLGNDNGKQNIVTVHNFTKASPGKVFNDSQLETGLIVSGNSGSMHGSKPGGRKKALSRSERSASRKMLLQKLGTERQLDHVVASLTDSELKELDSSITKILIPALTGLETVVLKELEGLRDISIQQELRLEKLENSKHREKEVIDAVKVIREEKLKLEGKGQKNELGKLSPNTSVSSSSNEAFDTKTANMELEPALSIPEPLEGNDSESGSGSPEMLTFSETTVATVTTTTMTTPVTTTTAATRNHTESSDGTVINHIYEIYSSLTSMEHKVMELDTRLASVSSELYRQRSTFVRLDDKAEEIRRNQKNLVMRTTMHGFKLSDLEQFKGRADILLSTAEGTIEKFDAKLEIFKDRVMEQQDEVQIMRNVFSRLEQVSNELRSADAFKDHDIQELKRSAQHVDSRLVNLHHTLDHYVSNIRWDVKTYLDNLCASNNLQC